MPGGFYLPNCNRERRFDTATSKAHFNAAKISTIALEKDELLMMTIRSHDQFNTTIYGLNDRDRGIYNERRVILMSRGDAEANGLCEGHRVNIYNYDDGSERVAENFVVVIYPIPEKCCATYFPEANVLVPVTSVADKSNTPCSKQVVIRVKRHEESFTSDREA